MAEHAVFLQGRIDISRVWASEAGGAGVVVGKIANPGEVGGCRWEYDAAIGRFLSADPIVQAPYYSQSLNRYSYVWNNPLGFVDPSGYEGTDYDPYWVELVHDTGASADLNNESNPPADAGGKANPASSCEPNCRDDGDGAERPSGGAGGLTPESPERPGVGGPPGQLVVVVDPGILSGSSGVAIDTLGPRAQQWTTDQFVHTLANPAPKPEWHVPENAVACGPLCLGLAALGLSLALHSDTADDEQSSPVGFFLSLVGLRSAILSGAARHAAALNLISQGKSMQAAVAALNKVGATQGQAVSVLKQVVANASKNLVQVSIEGAPGTVGLSGVNFVQGGVTQVIAIESTGVATFGTGTANILENGALQVSGFVPK